MSLFYAILVRRAGLAIATLDRLRSGQIADVYAYLQQIASQQTIQDGLLLGSHSLLERLETFVEKDPTSFRKKERQTAQKLLEYVTRAAAKTSPLGAFGPVGLHQIMGGLITAGGANEEYWSVNRRVYSAI